MSRCLGPMLRLASALVMGIAGAMATPAVGANESPRAAVTSNPGLTPIVAGRLGRAAYDEGRRAFERGNYVDAVLKFAEAARYLPDMGLLYVDWAEAATRKGEDPRAVKELASRAAALLPDNPRAQWTLATAAARADDIPLSITSYDRAIALRPQHDAWRFERAQILIVAGRIEDARTDLRSLVLEAPAHLGAHRALADLEERAGNIGAAESSWLAIVRAQPTNPVHREELAAFYERTKQPAKARAARADSEALRPSGRRMRRLR